ncbi:hypothetical protein ANO11243_038630 [Dothideomycetidae sp. 11243]|nr:hypothetical protein ANO11243_038630 [fungal sp. No.11243]
MPFSSRRQRLLIALTIVLLILYLNSKWITTGGLILGESQSAIAPAFNWRDLPLRYPQDVITPLPKGPPKKLPRIQFNFGKESSSQRKTRKRRQKAVKDTFLRSWSNYKRLAWGADELTPITGKPKNNYGGWGASLVDNLDTLWIMGLKDEFRAAAKSALKIRFDTSTSEEVNVFETTIRYLGGFLSAYDLSGDRLLLEKAVELGDMLLVAFDTPNHLPITRWRMAEARNMAPQEAKPTVLVAEIGSLSLEFTRLAQRTGDNRYYSAIEAVTATFAAQQNKTLIPGLWPVNVNALTADFTQYSTFTLGGMADSVFEYLPKMHALLGGTDLRYRAMYESFSSAALEHMIRPAMVPSSTQDVLVSIDVIAGTPTNLLIEQGQHLVCFAGGMFALAGRLLSLPDHVDVGRRLTDGCLWAYHAMPTGIMPEIFKVVTCPPTSPCKWNETLWRAAVAVQGGYINPTDAELDAYILEQRLPKGITDVIDRKYMLRPETIESVFILYRITGDQRWADEAWTIFEAIMSVTATGLANGMVVDVSKPKDKVEIADVMESFWMAETLKYFYLVFSEPDLISLDQYVFNTEAHPFRRPIGE